MTKTRPRPPKLTDLLGRVKACLQQGNYKMTRHALVRKDQRVIPLSDIAYILKNGRHEKIKDQWDEKFQNWNYAIRGKTLAEDDIRIIVCFDDSGMLIITVIRINREV